MTINLNVPIMGQLLDTTETNRYWDCVPTSIASALQYLTSQSFDGGQIKDTVYGPAYVGGTAAIAYVDYCKRYGVNLYAINDVGKSLVNQVCDQLAAGHPCLLTEPDPYDNPQLYSHVVLACGYDMVYLYVMDPYIQQIIKKTRDEWAATLEYNQIWVLRKGTNWMDAFLGPHSNDTRSQLWNSFSLGIGKTPPRQQTGFFHSWVDLLNQGINKGSPLGPEQPLTLAATGKVVMSQNFPGGTVIWDDATLTATWL